MGEIWFFVVVIVKLMIFFMILVGVVLSGKLEVIGNIIIYFDGMNIN